MWMHAAHRPSQKHGCSRHGGQQVHMMLAASAPPHLNAIICHLWLSCQSK